MVRLAGWRLAGFVGELSGFMGSLVGEVRHRRFGRKIKLSVRGRRGEATTDR